MNIKKKKFLFFICHDIYIIHNNNLAELLKLMNYFKISKCYVKISICGKAIK